MPIRNITPSSYVGPQTRKFRTARGWSQQKLADRLREELGAESTGWSQTKINKLERGRLTRVLVDDVFELALALDVSPLYLLTPLEGFDEDEKALKVWIGGKIARWPREVRQWVRGVRPLLGLGDYRTDEEAQRGHRFYLLESQPLSELRLIAEAGKQGDRIGDLASELVGSETPDA